MNSDNEAVKEVLDVLFSHLEKLETQTEGMMQFLKEKKKVTDAQLGPYLENAGKAANVRWRAARVRIEYLIAGAARAEEKEREKDREKKPEIAAQANEAAKPVNPGPWGQGVAVEKSEDGKPVEENKGGNQDAEASKERGDSTEGDKKDSDKAA